MKTKKNSTDFYLNLKKLRQSKNISGAVMAQMLELKQQTYNRYELNQCEPPFSTLIKIAQLLNVSTDFLLGTEKVPHTPGVTQKTTNGHNINGNSNVVIVNAAPADADEVASLKAEIQALKNKLEYATELIAKLTK